jgi:imidazolonepropionase-like amidohydrolase
MIAFAELLSIHLLQVYYQIPISLSPGIDRHSPLIWREQVDKPEFLFFSQFSADFGRTGEPMPRPLVRLPRPHGFRLWLLALSFGIALATRHALADLPRTAGFEPRAFAITKARIVIAPGQLLEHGNVIVRDGLITAVAADASIPLDAEVIDASGLTVYPGFIDAAASVLLDPAEPATPAAARAVDFSRFALAATPPDNRKSLTPEFRAAESLKLDLPDLEQRRKLGFTALQIVPSGRIASGQGALISTGGGPPRESLLQSTTMAEFQLFGPGESGYPRTLMGATAHLRQAFLDGRHHTRHWELYRSQAASVARPPVDPTLESLHDLIGRPRGVLFLAQTRDDIHRALDFCVEQELQPTIWGGREAWRCAERLQELQTSVILDVDYGDEPKVEAPAAEEKLDPEEKDPLRVQEDRLAQWKQRVASPAVLHSHQVRFAFSSHGLQNPADLFKGVRHLIKNGLPRDAALAAMTVNAAALLGQEARLGTLTAGKLAHVAVLTGPFDDEHSQLRYLFVDGRKYEYNSNAKPVPSEEEKSAKTADVAGVWHMEIDASESKFKGILNLTQSGGKLSGTFQSPQGNGKLTSGTATAEAVDFIVAIGAGDQAVELKFAGKLAGERHDELSGTLKSAFGAPTAWSAHRSPLAAAQPASKNPVQLGVEAGDPDSDSAHAANPSPPAQAPTELESDRLRRALRTGGDVFIKQGTVLTGRGETLPETSLLIKGGKFVAIGRDLQPEPGMAVLDATGKYVMPGIIDTHSHIMIGGGMGGVNEGTLSIVPEVRIKDVVWTDDPSEYRALAGGVTTARLLHGSANVIGGQDAVVKLKYGATAREQIVADAPQGVKFALGENVKFQAGRFPNTRMGVEATLNRAFLEAIDYRRQWLEYQKAAAASNGSANQLLPPRRDLRLEALREIVDHQKFIHSHCYRADEILMLLRVASNLGLRVWSLQHVLEGYKVAPEIVAHGASCSTFADWWGYKVEAFDAIPFNAALLQEAGANVVIKSDDWELIRHLYQEAAKTMRYGGLTAEQALQTITYNPARELGLQERIGSIEVGKEADLAIFNGHPLNSFSRCEQTLIAGEVYFSRGTQPSAMSAAGATRSATPAAWAPPAAELRTKRPDWSESPSGQYALVGAFLHPLDSEEIPGGTLLIADGKITALGKELPIPTNAKTIDLAGLHVYPGLIDAGTTVGLVEIGKVTETHDSSEGGQFQPDLRAGVAINADSELIPVARAGGITTILARPGGSGIAGQCSVANLAGWTAPDMILEYEAGLQINWPSGDKAKEQIEQLKDFLELGRLYLKARSEPPPADRAGAIADPRFDALRPYLTGAKKVFIEANSRREIAEALLFAETEKLKLVITGGADAWKLAAELKKRDVPVIVGPVMRKPIAEFDPFDAPYANPGRLFESGVSFCIRSNNATNSRNAPFEAAMAVAYGLPETEALQSVTLAAARVLGIDDRVGSLTPGKLANVIVTDGSPLQVATQIKGVFVAGKPFAPTSRQTRLHEKYQGRLKKRN